MKIEELSKQQLGKAAEFEVTSRLLLHGWDACNSNLSQNNFRTVDVFCLDSVKNKLAAIQIKSTTKDSFPCGFSMGEFIDGSWRSKICGPWVFVHISGDSEDPHFRFFILSQAEMIQMIEATHDWYVNKWDRKGRQLSNNGVVCLSLSWLSGEVTAIPAKKTSSYEYSECIMPLNSSAENKWDKIWE